MKRILGTYEITWGNGFVQQKNLIRHEDYLNVIAPKRAEAYRLELEIYSLPKKSSEIRAKENRVRQLRREISQDFGSQFFTDKSPLFDAISTGVCSQMPHARYTDSCVIKHTQS